MSTHVTPDDPAPRTPAFILTGFLGSGKTTLLNAALRDPALADTAVIVNEFGDIGLDQHLIASSTDNVVLLESGCLCCTLGDSLHETLAELHRRRGIGEIPTFARIIVETTGLADPAPLINTMLAHRLVTDVYRLSSVVTTVDGEHADAELSTQWEVRKQIALADLLIITKADRIDTESLRDLDQRLRGMNPMALRSSSALGTCASEVFTDAEDSSRFRIAPLPDAQQRHDDIRSISAFIDHRVSWAGWAAWTRLATQLFGDRMLRVKGLLRMADDDSIRFVQGVQREFHSPQRFTVWPDADPRGRLVCIGKDINADEFDLLLPALRLQAGSDSWISLDDLAHPR